jgi:hypothetical protein
MPVIEEVKIKRIEVSGESGQKVCKTPSQWKKAEYGGVILPLVGSLK